jgi:trans-2,3-dihydro-3-hydroxyanthranilate isomerase
VTASFPVVHADVFTTRPFAGNPAVAVLDADLLDETAMPRIAGEMRTAGTAFVSQPRSPGVDWWLRMFTPEREVAYSGHTALCAVHALVEAGRVPGPHLRFETPAGQLQVDIERGDGAPLMWLLPPAPALAPREHGLDEILHALGLPRAGLAPWARPAVTPDRDLLVPVRDMATLRGLKPDMAGLALLQSAAQDRGVCCVTLETVDPGSATHCRFFAPHYGLPEDIVTGSVHSPMAVWLLDAGALETRGGRAVYTAEQGDGLGRPGRLRIDVTTAAGHAMRARVGGHAVTVWSGRLRA